MRFTSAAPACATQRGRAGHWPADADGSGAAGRLRGRSGENPCIVDADTGFGGAETRAHDPAISSAGSRRCATSRTRNSEALRTFAGKSLGEYENERKYARGGRGKRDKDFLLIARTDARAVESFAKTVERAQSYLRTGADAIFPEALQNEQEFRDFAKEVKAPLLANMTEFGKSPLLSLGQLAEFGYRMVIYPQTAFRVSMFAASQMLRDLKASGTQEAWLDRMQTRQELYKLLDYDPAADRWTG